MLGQVRLLCLPLGSGYRTFGYCPTPSHSRPDSEAGGKSPCWPFRLPLRQAALCSLPCHLKVGGDSRQSVYHASYTAAEAQSAGAGLVSGLLELTKHHLSPCQAWREFQVDGSALISSSFAMRSSFCPLLSGVGSRGLGISSRQPCLLQWLFTLCHPESREGVLPLGLLSSYEGISVHEHMTDFSWSPQDLRHCLQKLLSMS